MSTGFESFDSRFGSSTPKRAWASFLFWCVLSKALVDAELTLSNMAEELTLVPILSKRPATFWGQLVGRMGKPHQAGFLSEASTFSSKGGKVRGLAFLPQGLSDKA
jgi:hypothetical protein